METKKCKKCGQVFTPAYDTELYCDDCQEEHEEQELNDYIWEVEMNYGSDYSLDDLIDGDDEDDE